MTIRKGQIGAFGVAALYSGDVPILVFGDGSVIWGDKEYPATEFGALDAAICPSTGGLIVLGDFGNIIRMKSNGEISKLLEINDFADKLIINQKREMIGINTGRKTLVFSLKTKEKIFEFTPIMSPNSLAFDVMGENLVVGHGKGLTIYDLKTNDPPIEFSAPGGVSAATFSPDLRFLIAATGEPCLVGWHLQDGRGFRMAGYPQRPNSFSWIDTGKTLLTSGGPVLVSWPFGDELGPMGQRAQTYRGRNSIVNVVAGQKNMVALGFIDGGVDMLDLNDKEFHHIGGPEPDPNQQIDPREGKCRITSIAMPRAANAVAWVGEDGGWGIAKYG